MRQLLPQLFQLLKANRGRVVSESGQAAVLLPLDRPRQAPPALIVDLRGNGGGIDVGNEIVKRLVTSDLRISTGKRFVRYRRTPENLAPFLDTRDPSFKNWDAAVNLAQP